MPDHKYKHYNRSLGCWVEGKEHFKYLLLKHGLVPQGVAERLIKDTHKEYKQSEEAKVFMGAIKQLATDIHGRIVLNPAAIKKMKELGVNFDKAVSEINFEKGGFSASS